MNKCLACGKEYEYEGNKHPGYMYFYCSEKCRNTLRVARKYANGGLTDGKARNALRELGITSKETIPANCVRCFSHLFKTSTSSSNAKKRTKQSNKK